MLELGILKTFDSGTHKAGVQLVGSLTTYLDDIAVATNIAAEAMIVGNYVLVAIPGGNPRDACVVASWPAGSSGGGGGGSKIQDADGDTYLWVEKTADEDKIHGVVKNVEAFLLHDDGILDLPKQSGCAVYLGTDQSISTGSPPTLANLNTKSYDPLNEYNTTTHRFTATKAGFYVVIGATNWNTPLPNKRYAAILFVNGAYVTETINHSSNSGRMGVMTSGIFYLAANDYVELMAYQDTGANDNLDSGVNHTYLHIAKIA